MSFIKELKKKYRKVISTEMDGRHEYKNTYKRMSIRDMLRMCSLKEYIEMDIAIEACHLMASFVNKKVRIEVRKKGLSRAINDEIDLGAEKDGNKICLYTLAHELVHCDKRSIVTCNQKLSFHGPKFNEILSLYLGIIFEKENLSKLSDVVGFKIREYTQKDFFPGVGVMVDENSLDI